MTNPEPHPFEGDLDELSWLRRLARRLVADAHKADDAVQEAWLAARGKPTRNRRGFLATTVLNMVRQDARSRGRRGKREDEVGRRRADESPSASETAQRLERSRLLLDALEGLEEPYRSAVTLRYLDDLPPRKIASRLGVPVRTVNTRLERGLAKLRARLDQRFDGDRDAWLQALAPFGWTLGDALVATLSGAAMTTKFVLGATLTAAVAAAAILVSPDAGGARGRSPAEPSEPQAEQPTRREETAPATEELQAVAPSREAQETVPATPAETATDGRARLAVRVSAVTTGLSLEGVRVQVYRADAKGLSQGALASGSTDRDGRVEVEVPAGLDLRIVARPASGTREGGARIEALSAGSDDVVDVLLETGLPGRFHGEVVDDVSGSLLPGAHVLPFDPRLGYVREGDLPLRGDEESVHERGAADGLGRFVVEYAPWSPHEVWVAKNGYWPERLDLGRQDQGPGRPFTVRLRPAATVRVEVQGLASPKVVFRNAAAEPVASPTATFTLPPDQEVHGEVWGEDGELLWRAEPLRLEPGEVREILWVVNRRVRVFGLAKNQFDEPIPGHEVVAVPAKPGELERYETFLLERDGRSPVAWGVTDSEGRFDLGGLAPGDWWIALGHTTDPGDNATAASGQGVRLEVGEGEREVLLRSDRGLFITGRVVGPGGAPFAGGTISSHASRLLGRGKSRLDGNGEFRLGPLPDDVYRLWVIGPGYMSAGSFLARGGERVELALGDHHAIGGSVVSSSGQTFRAHVNLISDRGSWGMGVSGSSMGQFLFGELDERVYTVKATTEDGRVAVIGGLDVSEGQAHTDLTLVLKYGGKIRVEFDGPPGFRCIVTRDGVQIDNSSMRGTVFTIAPAGEVEVAVVGRNAEGESVRLTRRVTAVPGEVQEVKFSLD